MPPVNEYNERGVRGTYRLRIGAEAAPVNCAGVYERNRALNFAAQRSKLVIAR